MNRQRLPKNSLGAHWSWKEINIGTDVSIYGRVFHVYDCNAWTKVCLLLHVGYCFATE